MCAFLASVCDSDRRVVAVATESFYARYLICTTRLVTFFVSSYFIGHVCVCGTCASSRTHAAQSKLPHLRRLRDARATAAHERHVSGAVGSAVEGHVMVAELQAEAAEAGDEAAAREHELRRKVCAACVV